MSRQLKTFAVYALWGVAAAGILAAVLYVVLARGGEANNPEANIIENGSISKSAPDDPTPDAGGGLVGGAAETLRAPDSIVLDAYRQGRSAHTYGLSLFWTIVSGAVRYDVERDSGDGYAAVGWSDSVTFADTLTVDETVRVSYRVRACAHDGGADCGPWSDPVVGLLQPLLAPTGLTAAVADEASGNPFTVKVSWSGQNTGTRYRVERDTGAGWERAGQAERQTSSYIDTVTVPQAVTVKYRVLDCEGDACSPASNTAYVELAP